MYTRTFVLFLIFILYTFIVIFAIMCEKGRKRPEVFRGALPVHAILCYLVLKKAFSQGILRNVTFAFLDS